MTHVEFVLQYEFEELRMAEATRGGFLQTHVEGLGQAGEAELAQGSLELGHVEVLGVRGCAGSMR